MEGTKAREDLTAEVASARNLKGRGSSREKSWGRDAPGRGDSRGQPGRTVTGASRPAGARPGRAHRGLHQDGAGAGPPSPTGSTKAPRMGDGPGGSGMGRYRLGKA